MATVECHSCNLEMVPTENEIAPVWQCPQCGREFMRSGFDDLELMGGSEIVRCVVCLRYYPENGGWAFRYSDGREECMEFPGDHGVFCSSCTRDRICEEHSLVEH